MRVLLVESEQEDVVFLRDVLAEIGEGHYWNNWISLEILHAVSWLKATEILAGEAPDIVLLDLNVLESQGIEIFRRAQRVAQSVPMVLLIGAGEESLGVQLVREGAQDFLVKKEVDCAPLAHAMRNAIERHRLLTASRASSTHDLLTGLLNREGFLTAAHRDCKLAERLGRRLMVMTIEIPPEYDEQHRDMALIEAADRLRGVASPADLLARLDLARFGMTIFDSGAESLEAAWARIHAAMRPHRIRIGTAIFLSERPVTLDALLEQAAHDLEQNDLRQNVRPNALAQGAP